MPLIVLNLACFYFLQYGEFLFVSTEICSPAPSILTSQLATLQLKMVQSVTSAHKGLAPYRLIPIFIGKDAHAGHTQSKDR